MLAPELLFLLNSVVVVLDEAARGRDIELRDAAVIELINGLVKCVSVHFLALFLQLSVQFGELVLDRFGLNLKLFIVELMLWEAIDSKFLRILEIVFLSSFALIFGVSLLVDSRIRSLAAARRSRCRPATFSVSVVELVQILSPLVHFLTATKLFLDVWAETDAVELRLVFGQVRENDKKVLL